MMDAWSVVYSKAATEYENMTNITADFPTKFCSDSKYSLWVTHPEWRLLSTTVWCWQLG